MISWLCSRMSCCVISEVQHPAFSVSSARSKCCRSCVGQAGVCMGPCCLEAGLLFAHVHVSTESWGWGHRMLLFSKQPHTSFSCVFVSCPAAPRGCGRQCWWQPPKQTFSRFQPAPSLYFSCWVATGCCPVLPATCSRLGSVAGSLGCELRRAEVSSLPSSPGRGLGSGTALRSRGWG